MWVSEKALHVGDEASTSLKRWDLWTEVAPLSSERAEDMAEYEVYATSCKLRYGC
jgi:hypothetical protein